MPKIHRVALAVPAMLLVLGAGAFAGCESQPFPPTPVAAAVAPRTAPAAPPADAAPAATAETVELKEVTFAGLDAAVKEHKGKVVAIDVWFLGCAPCVKKFPHLVQMAKDHAAEGLVCMSLNPVDLEPADREKALKFLKAKGAAFPNFVVKDTEENEKKWSKQYPTTVTPALILVDRKGEVVKVITDEPNVEAIDAEVRKVLGAK
ncbi:TlpA family protein disulfide reductase [Fimbriiglobus ruber]|uniref:Thioredoxin-like n=1 Tax=Fimbriiglobus ruber TaxID=1908690 RepID=A0A225DBZ0_9BACT|nr:TlpA disulfide reductase family protein [Fimbriiglobus ruber]OWK38503.1 Thioredoxin-like [Fimbriiglobus ruber]